MARTLDKLWARRPLHRVPRQPTQRQTQRSLRQSPATSKTLTQAFVELLNRKGPAADVEQTRRRMLQAITLVHDHLRRAPKQLPHEGGDAALQDDRLGVAVLTSYIRAVGIHYLHEEASMKSLPLPNTWRPADEAVAAASLSRAAVGLAAARHGVDALDALGPGLVKHRQLAIVLQLSCLARDADGALAALQRMRREGLLTEQSHGFRETLCDVAAALLLSGQAGSLEQVWSLLRETLAPRTEWSRQEQNAMVLVRATLRGYLHALLDSYATALRQGGPDLTGSTRAGLAGERLRDAHASLRDAGRPFERRILTSWLHLASRAGGAQASVLPFKLLQEAEQQHLQSLLWLPQKSRLRELQGEAPAGERVGPDGDSGGGSTGTDNSGTSGTSSPSSDSISCGDRGSSGSGAATESHDKTRAKLRSEVTLWSTVHAALCKTMLNACQERDGPLVQQVFDYISGHPRPCQPDAAVATPIGSFDETLAAGSINMGDSTAVGPLAAPGLWPPALCHLALITMLAHDHRWADMMAQVHVLDAASLEQRAPYDKPPHLLQEWYTIQAALFEALSSLAKEGDLHVARQVYNYMASHPRSASHHMPAVQAGQVIERGGDSSSGVSSTAEGAATAPGAPARLRILFIRALTRHQLWGEVVDEVHALCTAYPDNLQAASSYDGLGSVVRALAGDPAAQEAVRQLVVDGAKCKATAGQQQQTGTPMMNVLLRAKALVGDMADAARFFDDFHLAGVTHDVNSYNAMLESCVAAKQVPALEPMLARLEGLGFCPDATSLDLLVQGHASVQDWEALRVALERAVAAGVQPMGRTLDAAMAAVQGDTGPGAELVRQQVQQVLDAHKPTPGGVAAGGANYSSCT